MLRNAPRGRQLPQGCQPCPGATRLEGGHTANVINPTIYNFTMAKGNLILGTASRSIGDVTMYRRNGQQVSRARVRKIGNPRTEGQAKQRMLQAALTRFYSPLASCLEKSFEGKNKMDSYSKYLSVNNRIGRNMFAVPKNASWVPVPVKVSGGTMPSPTVTWVEDGAGFILDAKQDGDLATLGDLSSALKDAYGLEEGDQVTVIFAKTSGDSENEVYTPYYFRFFIKSTSVDAKPSYFGVKFWKNVDNNIIIQEGDDNIVACAVIFSRYENGTWRRSNSYMALGPTLLADFTGTEGIAKWLDEWMNGTTVPTSDVYLNGSTESPLTPHAGSVTLTMSGKEYTFIGSGHRVIGKNDYAYLITSEGERMYIKEIGEKSDAYGKFADARQMSLTNLSDMQGIDAPTGIADTNILGVGDGYTEADGELLVKFAAAHGWTPTGATAWFGING